jgi:predicted dehydrogenase
VTNTICRWGILGAANIARKNWQAIVNAGNGQLVAVASRDPSRAAQFIRECQASAPHPASPRGCTYEALLASKDIDAVYIPLPTGIRKEWVIRAAQAGKHVLCEKPCAANAADLAEMIAACQQNNVQFMDGVMFMHSARLGKIREALSDRHSVGAIKRITSQFSFLAPEGFMQQNIRASGALEPLGCLGDLGWYNIRFTLWTMNYALPERVSGRLLHATDAGVPLEFSAELFFSGGVSASFYCTFLAENQQWAMISGAQGHLRVPDFVLPFFGGEAAFELVKPAFEVYGCQFNMVGHTRRIAVPEYSNNFPNSQETNLFRKFGELALAGKPDPIWGEIALQTQQVMDACLASARQGGALVEI